ncbi:MAG: hypothetical protein ACRDJM_11330, partial [Actinomycetota bacterium]
GARSLAARGRSAAQILAHFYNGLMPVAGTEPASIRVLVAEGATAVRLEPENGGQPAGAAITGEGPAFEVRPTPDGPAITRTGPAANPSLRIEDRGTSTSPGRAAQRVFLPSPTRIATTLSIGGRDVLKHPETSYERGEHTLTLVEPDLPALAAGTYRLRIDAYDGLDRGMLETTLAFVPAPGASPSSPLAAPPIAAEPIPRRPLWPVAAALGLVLVLGGFVAGMVRRRTR